MDGTEGVDEDEGNPMTTVGAGGGWSDSSPARVDNVDLDMGVATGGVIEGSRVQHQGIIGYRRSGERGLRCRTTTPGH